MTKCRDTGNEYLRDDDEEEEDETLDVMEELKTWNTSFIVTSHTKRRTADENHGSE